MKTLFDKANLGDLSILSDPQVTILKDDKGCTPLHWLAYYCRIEVLNHPEVATVKNDHGDTPLHFLAVKLIPGVLKHPLVAVVKNIEGDTPLHKIARLLIVLDHSKVAIVKNNLGKTPLHILIAANKHDIHTMYLISKKLNALFPWYIPQLFQLLNDGKFTHITIDVDEIVNTPNSIKYMY